MIQVLAPFAPLFSERVFQHVQVLWRARSSPREKDRSLRPASGGSGRRTALLSLPSGLEPRRLVESGGKPRPAGVARGGLRAEWTARVGRRRDPGAAPGEEDRRQGHLPRPGAFQPRALRQNERPQMGVPDALAPVPWASRVWALPFLCALAYSERYAQEQGKRHKSLTEWAWQLLLLVRRWYPEREIVAVADGGYASLKLLDRCRSSQEPDHLHHSLAAGRRSLRAGPAPQARTDGKTSPEGLSPSEPLGGGRRPKDGLDAHHGERLVRRWRTHGGDGLGTRHLVLHGLARRAVALGVDPRSQGGVRNPSSACAPISMPIRSGSSRGS